MRIAIRKYFTPAENTIDGFGGGEQRWSANLAHFLSREGHDVIRCAEGEDAGCDLFLDASWERCQFGKARAHIHFSFSGANAGALQFPESCINTGTCNFACPYLETHQETIRWTEFQPNVNPIFLPQPYPDDLLPAHSSIHGFERNGIFWGTKDMFHPNFCKPECIRPDGREQVFVQNGLDTLRALLRLQRRVNFDMTFILAHHLQQSPERLGVRELLQQFRNVKFGTIVAWTTIIDVLSSCKLSVPVGGLWGSTPESMFAKSLPMLYPNNQFYAGMQILPLVLDATEDSIYDTLERLWFDRDAYTASYNALQEKFKDHRTEGLRKNFAVALQKVGL